MTSWAGYILGPIYAMLPKRWRYIDHHSSERFMARSAMASGILESVVALLILRYWYVFVLGWISDAYAKKALSLNPGNFAHIAPEFVGGAGFLVFAGNPLTWILLYFLLEGILRLTAAVISREACGILPLCAMDLLYQLATHGRAKPDLPLIRDEVLSGDSTCDLRIVSCRQRPDWKYPFTIRFQKAFFQVIATQTRHAGPRPFEYSLRRLPPGEVARGLHDYDPDDVLVTVLRVQSLG